MPRRTPFSFATFNLTVQTPMRAVFGSSSELPRAMQDVLDLLDRPYSLSDRLADLQRICDAEVTRRD